jgi:hypothetical protein
MPRVRLPTINDPPEGRTVLNAAIPEPDAHPYFSSRGDLDLACGRCDRVLAENVPAGWLRNLVLQCPNCLAYNDLA